MVRVISAVVLVFVGMSINSALGAYPSYTAGYGFVSHGGIGPHGHYLPAVARVKVHKDPFQSHYSLDEEGPTHYKYIRQTSAPDPILHHPQHFVSHGHIGHHHVAPIAAHPIPIHGGVIAAAGPAAIAVGGVGYHGGYHGGHIYDDYGHGHGAYGHGGFY